MYTIDYNVTPLESYTACYNMSKFVFADTQSILDYNIQPTSDIP